jgi:signal transduction histidine kinase
MPRHERHGRPVTALQQLFSLRGSIAARLAVGYGLLVAASVAALSAIFYFGTVGVFEHSIDNKIQGIATRMEADYRVQGMAALERQVEEQLHDRTDTDTEIMGLVDADGRSLMGNLPPRLQDLPPPGQLSLASVQRNGGIGGVGTRADTAPVSVRLMTVPLERGVRLVVGRDLSELDAIRSVIERALVLSGAVSLLLAFAGAQLFRQRLEARIGDIRRTAASIAAGELSSRIDLHGSDEFARLGADINSMLDRIEALMEGVRHVSNSIAHDLRTPLSRVRSRLERALQSTSINRADPHALASDARLAIEDIDSLIGLFDKLLQIAAAEAGVRTRSFETLDVAAIARDIAELYEPVADEQGMLLAAPGMMPGAPVPVRGDRHLIANALASLIDNAVKYAREGIRIDIGATYEEDGAARQAVLTVRDYGPGVPPDDLERVCRRFYRVDQSRHLPGNGLGLSTVTAIARLHDARLELRNAAPGLEVRIVFPAG